jgi:hypothetical protein
VDCLRLLQQQATSINTQQANFKTIAVKARPCIGPCGDGPCVLVLDETGKRVMRPQPDKLPGSLVPPDIFGDNPVGVYQVRTQGHLDFVMDLAAEAAGLERKEEGSSQDDPSTVIVQSTRPWYDRPRNERKVLQRLMQFTVLAGLYDYQSKHDGAIHAEQWQVAISLATLSNFIMKENLLETLFTTRTKRINRQKNVS